MCLNPAMFARLAKNWTQTYRTYVLVHMTVHMYWTEPETCSACMNDTIMRRDHHTYTSGLCGSAPANTYIMYGDALVTASTRFVSVCVCSYAPCCNALDSSRCVSVCKYRQAPSTKCLCVLWLSKWRRQWAHVYTRIYTLHTDTHTHTPALIVRGC